MNEMERKKTTKKKNQRELKYTYKHPHSLVVNIYSYLWDCNYKVLFADVSQKIAVCIV